MAKRGGFRAFLASVFGTDKPKRKAPARRHAPVTPGARTAGRGRGSAKVPTRSQLAGRTARSDAARRAGPLRKGEIAQRQPPAVFWQGPQPRPGGRRATVPTNTGYQAPTRVQMAARGKPNPARLQGERRVHLQSVYGPKPATVRGTAKSPPRKLRDPYRDPKVPAVVPYGGMIGRPPIRTGRTYAGGR